MEHPDPSEESTPQLQPCSICGRTFRPDALSRHLKVCEKNASKKRKVFDSSKQRALEEAPPRQRAPSKQRAAPPPAKKEKGTKSNWREKHEDLIRTIKQARGQDQSKTPQEKRVPSDYVECPGCGRHFNQKAADRHVPWCQEKKKDKMNAKVKCRPPQGKSRKEESTRKTQLKSSPPVLLDHRNQDDAKKRSLSRERAKVRSQPELPLHIIKFKEKFPNHVSNRNCDLHESMSSEQLRELLSVSRITDRGPKTVPGVRLSGSNHDRSTRSSDVSRSSSSSDGYSNSWDNRNKVCPDGLPEVSSSEGVPWSAKPCWDLESSPPYYSCHRCGSKFPLPGAKYCCECGAKRLSNL